MKHMRRLICMALMIATVLSLSVSAFAAEYTFESTSDSEYYPSTSYSQITPENINPQRKYLNWYRNSSHKGRTMK